MYRFGPGRLFAFGLAGVFGHGAGFATPRNTRPWLSTEGGYQRPPPPFSFGLPQSLSPPWTVENFQTVLPVLASSAYTTPYALPL